MCSILTYGSDSASARVRPKLRGRSLSLAIAMVLVSGSAGGNELLLDRILPLALARTAATAALSACEAQGYRVSVTVVGRDGLTRILMRGDGAGPHTLDSSYRKAYTSLSLGRSTSDLVDLLRAQPTAAGLRDMNENILILGGGLPIAVGEDVIGGIGVGGAPGAEKDEACAAAGIDQIRQHLK